jgi:LemA protein
VLAADPFLPALAIFALGALLGWVLVRAMARQDHHTWVLARAPLLPIRALAVGDDAWLRGVVRTEAPLVCPHFGVDCVAFRYQREREHSWTTTDKDGKTEHHSEWRTEQSESEAIDFVLDDGDRILVRADDATNEALQGLRTDYETTTLRHSAHVLEVDARISVLGVKQDDGSLAGEREVPCLWTRATRERRVASSARSEGWLFFSACLLPFLGGAVAVAWYLSRVRFDGTPLRLWLLAAASGLCAMLPFWGIGAWNRLVRLRQQVRAAFRQVDVDLAVRAGLVPNLTGIVRGYAAHETSLLQSLAALRSGRDDDAEAAARSVLVLHERYPQLRADPLYRDLHDRLWALEEKLAHTRQLYNDIATEWNDRIAQFPQVAVARLMRCVPATLFAGDDATLPPRLTA